MALIRITNTVDQVPPHIWRKATQLEHAQDEGTVRKGVKTIIKEEEGAPLPVGIPPRFSRGHRRARRRRQLAKKLVDSLLVRQLPVT
jgi:hypothetical protein